MITNHIQRLKQLIDNSLTEDEHLICFKAMNWNVIESVTEMIITKGLSFLDGRSDDFIVIEPLNGLTWQVEWLEIRQSKCSYILPI